MNTIVDRDEALYARFSLRNDQAALESLIERWSTRAYRVAICICSNSALAEEAVQDAFQKLLSQRNRFKDRGPGSFRAWFLSLVTNSARMTRRTERRAERKKLVPASEFMSRRGLGAASVSSQSRGEITALLERSLNSLDERWRTPLLLRYYAGMPQRELAAQLGISQQMASRRIEQGLGQLRMRLA